LAHGKGWIGVDLDGTLAKYEGWKGADHIGEPVPAMVDRVKRMLADGTEVRIFTARVWGLMCDELNPPSVQRVVEAEAALRAIKRWCMEQFGRELEVTCVKDFAMIALYDDRAFQVEVNTGRVIDDGKAELEAIEAAVAAFDSEAKVFTIHGQTIFPMCGTADYITGKSFAALYVGQPDEIAEGYMRPGFSRTKGGCLYGFTFSQFDDKLSAFHAAAANFKKLRSVTPLATTSDNASSVSEGTRSGCCGGRKCPNGAGMTLPKAFEQLLQMNYGTAYVTRPGMEGGVFFEETTGRTLYKRYPNGGSCSWPWTPNPNDILCGAWSLEAVR
jgi:hypothetical protein